MFTGIADVDSGMSAICAKKVLAMLARFAHSLH
jgi:hypothetical protein